MDSEHPLFIAYTSGTTGRPKGSVHVHGGFLAKVAESGDAVRRASDRLFWFADMGWIMGPWEIVGALALGATLACTKACPTTRATTGWWAFLSRSRVSILGISPTLIRALMRYGEAPVRAHDLSATRARVDR